MHHVITATGYYNKIMELSLDFFHTINFDSKEEILNKINQLLSIQSIEDSSETYTKEISKIEVGDLIKAVDMVTRIWIGQLDEVNYYCGLIGRDFEIKDELISLKKKYFPDFSYMMSYGIFNKKVANHAKAGYDIRVCLRNCLDKNNSIDFALNDFKQDFIINPIPIGSN